MSALFSESLCTPHQTRRVAVMMMVSMSVRDHSEMQNKESSTGCQRLFASVPLDSKIVAGLSEYRSEQVFHGRPNDPDPLAL